jgi:uncharacterized membrane protein
MAPVHGQPARDSGVFLDSIRTHLRHHGPFYAAAVAGVVFFLLMRDMALMLRLVASGDLFFFDYLLLKAIDASSLTTQVLKERACDEDEGIVLVVVIVFAIIVVSSIAIISVLNGRQLTPVAIALAIAGAPLGWLTLHTLAAFHFANLFYGALARDSAGGGLKFPATQDPGIWEFLYFAFVVGMTAQTSDVEVTNTAMRRAVLNHSVASFFYNTAIIAMAVNAIVALAT